MEKVKIINTDFEVTYLTFIGNHMISSEIWNK